MEDWIIREICQKCYSAREETDAYGWTWTMCYHAPHKGTKCVKIRTCPRAKQRNGKRQRMRKIKN